MNPRYVPKLVFLGVKFTLLLVLQPQPPDYSLLDILVAADIPMFLPLPRFVDGRSKLRKLASFQTESLGVHCIQLSLDGTLVAIGDDQGRLEVSSDRLQATI